MSGRHGEKTCDLSMLRGNGRLRRKHLGYLICFGLDLVCSNLQFVLD